MNYEAPRPTGGTNPRWNGQDLQRQFRALSPRVVLIALIAFALLIWIGWRIVGSFGGAGGGGGFGGGPGGGGGMATPVRAATAETGDMAVSATTIGRVLANATVDVKSLVDGRLLSAAFAEGQIVKKGDLLFQIDPEPFKNDLLEAEAAVASDKAKLANARSNASRADALAAIGAESKQNHEQANADAQSSEATLAADQAKLEQAKLQLGYTEIRSPINGKTGPVLVHPGNLIRANDTNALVEITQTQPVKISFNLPQGNLTAIQDRMKEGTLVATVALRAQPGTVQVDRDGKPTGSAASITVPVDFVDNNINNQTGTIELRATFDNPDMRLVPGELVDVTVRLNTLKQVVTVPRDAVTNGQNQNFVYVIGSDDKVEMRTITLLYENDTVAAIGSGVKSGEQVVTEGQLSLNPGSKVSVIAPGQETAPPGKGGPGGGKGGKGGKGGGGGPGGGGNGGGAPR